MRCLLCDVFGNCGNDIKSGEDGLLQVREVSELKLNGDLVILLACDTAVGALESNQGIVNLVRASLYAGAKSVVASLWAASDVHTRNLCAPERSPPATAV